jgi:hypothetical protein
VSGLLAPGDPLPHAHVLPPVPTVTVVVGPAELGMKREVAQVNAVAQCASCGRLFVSREDPDGWGRVVYWVRLRWWHRAARRKLRRLTP